MNEIMRQAAHQYLNHGYAVVLLREGQKHPAFKNWNACEMTRAQIDYWLRRAAFNVGVRLTDKGICIADCDGEDAERWCKEHGITSPMISQTARGFHIWMRHTVEKPSNRQRFKGMPLDVIFNAAVPVAPSWNAEKSWRYQWRAGIVRPEELPLFPGELLKEDTRRNVVRTVETNEYEFRLRRARLWMAKAEGAISGQGGHRRTFRIACQLAIYFDLNFDDVLDVMLDWNLKCKPQWSEGELRHKITDAFKRKNI